MTRGAMRRGQRVGGATGLAPVIWMRAGGSGTVGSGAARMQPRQRLGRHLAWALLLPALTAALSLCVPLVTLARWLLRGGFEVWRVD